jgi:hypothetical protein
MQYPRKFNQGQIGCGQNNIAPKKLAALPFL